MKVTVNVDCTPQEARSFFGLPDVEPMQRAIMDHAEKRMMREIENYAPEKFIEAWFPLFGANADWMRSMFGAFMQTGTGSSPKK
ncbi:MAG: hypothetical protein KGL46_06095 [Hyphomicrobiales bacterium]|nr:hypothetical protein [Hyphomicrobiales bacterium]